MFQTTNTRMAFQVLVFQPKSEDIVVTYEGKVAEAIYPDMGFRVPTLLKRATAPAGHTIHNTAPVEFLDSAELFPPCFMSGIPQGPREHFANAANLR